MRICWNRICFLRGRKFSWEKVGVVLDGVVVCLFVGLLVDDWTVREWGEVFVEVDRGVVWRAGLRDCLDRG